MAQQITEDDVLALLAIGAGCVVHDEQTRLFAARQRRRQVTDGFGAVGAASMRQCHRFGQRRLEAQRLAADGIKAAKAVQAAGLIARHPEPVAGEDHAGQVGLNQRVRSELQTDGIVGSSIGHRVSPNMGSQEIHAMQCAPPAFTKHNIMRQKSNPSLRIIRC